MAFKDRSRVPDDFSFGSFPDDMDHLEPHLMSAMHRLPLLGERGISTYFSGPESFTPDGNEMIGEFPEVPGLFVAAGYDFICKPTACATMPPCFGHLV